MTPTRALVIAVVWVVMWSALWLTDAHPSAIALAGVVAVIATAGFVAVDLGRSARQMRWPRPPEPGRAVGGARRAPRSIQSVDALVRSQPDEVHRRLVAVVDERLRRHHGVDRPTEPDAAELLLTPVLRSFVRAVPRRPPTERELWAVLDDIEAL